MKPTLLVSIASTRTIRFLLDTPLWKRWEEEYEITILTDKDLSAFVSSSCRLVPYPTSRGESSVRRIMRWFYTRFRMARHFENHRVLAPVFLEESLYNLNDVHPVFRSPLGLVVLRGLDKVWALWFSLASNAMKKDVFLRLFFDSNYRKMLRQLAPEKVVLTAQFLRQDLLLGAVCQQMQVPVWVYPEGWDYLFRPCFFDYETLFSWGPFFDKEYQRIQLPAEKIVGISHPLLALKTRVQAYRDRAARLKESWGIALDQKVITVYGSATYTSGLEHQRTLVRSLIRMVETHPQLRHAVILFRALPYDNQWADLEFLKQLANAHTCFLVRQGGVAFSDHYTGTLNDPNTELLEWISVTDVLVSRISHAVLEYGFCGVQPIVYTLASFQNQVGYGHPYLLSSLVQSGVNFVETESELEAALSRAFETPFNPATLQKEFSF